jgi:hypothetical protein
MRLLLIFPEISVPPARLVTVCFVDERQTANDTKKKDVVVIPEEHAIINDFLISFNLFMPDALM